jgi:hypothetical protein
MQNYSACSLMPTAHLSPTDQWTANRCERFFITVQGLRFLSIKSFIWRTFQGLLLHTISFKQEIFTGRKVREPWKTLNCSKELLTNANVSGGQRSKYIMQWSSILIPNCSPWFKILFKPSARRCWQKLQVNLSLPHKDGQHPSVVFRPNQSFSTQILYYIPVSLTDGDIVGLILLHQSQNYNRPSGLLPLDTLKIMDLIIYIAFPDGYER